MLSGTVEGTYSYPASEDGGSDSITLSWSEDVNIDILVDTSSFDYSVESLKHHVDGLTGAVVTTEALQIEEKAQSASAISQSVTTGFFDLIRSEITQQVVGLKSRVDSLFLKLNDMKLASQRVKQTMQKDYGRITDRYTSTFEELDRELTTRIATLDESAYAFRREASSQGSRSFASTLSTVPTVFGRESSQAQTALLAGIMHSRMNSLLQLSTAYLVSERQTIQTFIKILSDEMIDESTTHSLPVAYLAAGDPSAGSMGRTIFPTAPESPFDDDSLRSRITDQFQAQKSSWNPMTNEDRTQIERFLVPLIDAVHTSSPEQDGRVRRMILRLWTAHKPMTLTH
jgi:hypothetical protein